jgi:hypothetical protein
MDYSASDLGNPFVGRGIFGAGSSPQDRYNRPRYCENSMVRFAVFGDGNQRTGGREKSTGQRSGFSTRTHNERSICGTKRVRARLEVVP